MTRNAARLSGSLAATILGSLALVSAANARNAAPSQTDPLSTCQRAISRIGGQIGHIQRKDNDGSSNIFVFLVRSEGGEYAVQCNGATGTLGAIEPCWKRASTTCLAQSSGGTIGE